MGHKIVSFLLVEVVMWGWRVVMDSRSTLAACSPRWAEHHTLDSDRLSVLIRFLGAQLTDPLR